MARNNEDHKKSQRRPGRSGRTFGIVVASAVATAPFGCDDNTSKAPLVVAMDAGMSEDAMNTADAMNTDDALAMDTGSQVDATAAPDGDTDAGGAVDAAVEYPSGVRG